MNTFERAQEITDICPHTFGGVAMNFANPITIIIAYPFASAMGNSSVGPDDMVITLVFIGEDVRPDQRKLMDMLDQGLPLSIHCHPQADLPTFSTNRPDNGRAVIGIGATPTPLVGPATRRVIQVKVFIPLFPPHSETFRRSQMALLKYCSTVQIVRLLAHMAAIDRQFTLLGLTEDMSLIASCTAAWTLQPRWMKMLLDPLLTFVFVHQFCDWEFHHV